MHASGFGFHATKSLPADVNTSVLYGQVLCRNISLHIFYLHEITRMLREADLTYKFIALFKENITESMV